MQAYSLCNKRFLCSPQVFLILPTYFILMYHQISITLLLFSYFYSPQKMNNMRSNFWDSMYDHILCTFSKAGDINHKTISDLWTKIWKYPDHVINPLPTHLTFYCRCDNENVFFLVREREWKPFVLQWMNFCSHFSEYTVYMEHHLNGKTALHSDIKHNTSIHSRSGSWVCFR